MDSCSSSAIGCWNWMLNNTPDRYSSGKFIEGIGAFFKPDPKGPENVPRTSAGNGPSVFRKLRSRWVSDQLVLNPLSALKRLDPGGENLDLPKEGRDRHRIAHRRERTVERTVEG